MNKPNILILDDDRDLCELLQEQFDDAGLNSFIAGSINDGLRIIQENQIDLVLCDVFLDKENGIDFLKKAKRIDPTLKVIMMTAEPSIDLVIQGQRSGSDDFIVKPIFFPLLLLRVKHNLEVKSLNSRIAAITLENEKLKTIAQLGITLNDQLNSPLTALMGYLEFLKEYTPQNGDGYSDILEDMERTIELMRQRIVKIANLSRLQDKRYPQSNIGMFELNSGE